MSGMMLNFAGVTATSVPGAPTIGTVSVSVLTASVPFTAPASNGGSVITSYTATSSPSGITGTLNQAGSGTITVSGLASNTAYTFTVTATNIIGTGPASAASNSVTTANVPGAPTIGTAVQSGSVMSVPFTAPVSDGGSVITLYTATSSPGGITGTLSQAGSGTISVSGLSGGTSYTFTVTATNAIGTGAASAASNSVSFVATGQNAYIGTSTASQYTWVAPAGVTRATAIAVSPGASPCGVRYGGDLQYANNFVVVPGNSYTVRVTGNSNACTSADTYIREAFGCFNYYLKSGHWLAGAYCRGTKVTNSSCVGRAGTTGGGAGGYTGNGGAAATAGQACSGAAGGGASGGSSFIGGYLKVAGSGGGGGVGILGKGSTGAAGASQAGNVGANGGGGGSGGATGCAGGASSNCTGGYGGAGGNYGGGGGERGYTYSTFCCQFFYGVRGTNGVGAIRIIWPGCARSFPSTRTADE